MTQYTAEDWFNYGTLKNHHRREFNNQIAEANEELGSVLSLTESLGREIMGVFIKKTRLLAVPAGAMYIAKPTMPSLPIVLSDGDILLSSDEPIALDDDDVWQSYELPIVDSNSIWPDINKPIAPRDMNQSLELPIVELDSAIQVEDDDIIMERVIVKPVEDYVSEISFSIPGDSRLASIGFPEYLSGIELKRNNLSIRDYAASLADSKAAASAPRIDLSESPFDRSYDSFIRDEEDTVVDKDIVGITVRPFQFHSEETADFLRRSGNYEPDKINDFKKTEITDYDMEEK